ncbi:MAG TPA: riboflavin synthase [Acidimicrobiales bacterium]|nr:riboflavin synthase [Acidimicrobiales bacterium]
MFTGIVEELGRLRSRDGRRFVFEASDVLVDAKIGDSIAHNGCCLTIVEIGDAWYAVDVVDETLRRTNLGDLRPGDPVNLERPMRANGRFDGHIVQGHVDGTGEVVAPAPDLRIAIADRRLLRYLVEKGSITVDGVSLTVVAVLDDGFTVAIIPHTAEVTTLGGRRAGERVNLETDVLAKYVERLLSVKEVN